MDNKNKKIVEDFIIKFENENTREPTTEEIVNNLDTIIPANIIHDVVFNVQSIKIQSSSIADSLV